MRKPLATTHQWPRCRCGKVLCDSEADARRKRATVEFLTGTTGPVDYYKCGRAAGVWHWSDPHVPATCPCGWPPFSQSSAHKEAERINRARAGQRVQARPYECDHGGHHWLWYPVGSKFRYCKPCGRPAYPNPHAAALVKEHLERSTGEQYRIWRCTARWHLGPGVAECDLRGVHLGDDQWVTYQDETQRWWECCGEVDTYDYPVL